MSAERSSERRRIHLGPGLIPEEELRLAPRAWTAMIRVAFIRLCLYLPKPYLNELASAPMAKVDDRIQRCRGPSRYNDGFATVNGEYETPNGRY